MHDLTKADLQKHDTVFQIGVAPRRIDILTGLTGLKFEEVFSHAVQVSFDNIHFQILSIDDLITNKKATGRTKDLVDIEVLKSLK